MIRTANSNSRIAQIAREILFWSRCLRRSCDGVTVVGRLVFSRLLNFAAALECVYDPFLFPVLGTKESIKKGKTTFAIQLAVYIYQKYIHCRFIYLFVLYSEIYDCFLESGGNWYGSAPVKVLKLFPVACHYGWQGWKWIEI